MQEYQIFIKAYENASTESKVDFLFTLLNGNEKMQSAFMKHLENPDLIVYESMTIKEFSDLIEEEYQSFIEIFSEVDLEDLDVDYEYDGRYQKHWELHESAAQEVLKEIVESALYTITADAKSGNIHFAIAKLISFTRAINDARIEDTDDVVFDDVNGYLYDEFLYEIEDSLRVLSTTSFKEEILIDCLKLGLTYSIQNDFTLYNHTLCNVLQRYILVLARPYYHHKDLAQFVIGNDYIITNFPLLYSQFIKSNSHEAEWISFADKTYLENDQIAKEYLEALSESDRVKMVAVAKALYLKNNNHWCIFIANLITYNDDLDLFKKVKLESLHITSILEIFHEVRPFLSEQELNSFLDSTWNQRLWVEIVAFEQNFDAIKHRIDKNENLYDINFYLKTIAPKDPFYVLNRVKKIVSKSIENQRGRDAYRNMVLTLQILQNNEEVCADLQLFIKELVKNNSRLIAFKDELHIGGFLTQ